MLAGQSVTNLIEKRYSCRTYAGTPIAAETRRDLEAFLATHNTGPFGSTVRLALIAATEEDRQALKGLGTYGFIKNPMGFIAGAMHAAPARNLEDFGWVLEQIVLYATALRLGTVWLGGTFTKSRFAQLVNLREVESVPAVIAVGYPADTTSTLDLFIRKGASANQRLPWQQLFFEAPSGGHKNRAFDSPLSEDGARRYAEVLEMVRKAPSASNKQPWRIVRDRESWHLYLQRTRGYAARNALLGVADMQRIDMGIAMCHWELTAKELGLGGRWEVAEPPLGKPDDLSSYVASWLPGEARGNTEKN
jgi:nitroreductase